IGLALLLFNIFAPRPEMDMVAYSEFKEMIREGDIKRVDIRPELMVGFATAAPDTAGGALAAADTGKTWRTVPVEDPDLVALLDSAGVRYTASVDAAAGLKSFFFTWVLPALFFIGLWMLLMPRMGGGGGAGLFSLGKSKA